MHGSLRLKASARDADAFGAPILILGLNYAPEEIGIGPYTSGLAESLSDRGMKVRVITGRPYYPRWTPFEGSSRIWRRRYEGRVLVTRSPHYIPRQPSGSRRVVHHASFSISALFPALLSSFRRRPRLVMAVIPSLLSAPIGLLVARLTGAKLWLHIQDFELEAAFATGLLNPERLLSKLARRVERWLYSQADIVSTISPQMCARLKERGVPRERIYELRNWANHPARTGNIPNDGYRREWGLEGRKVALYSGNIANKQGLEIILEAARILQHREDLTFVICGNGPRREQLELAAGGLGNVIFKDLQPAERVPELLAAADVHLLPQLEEAEDLVLPSKLANMLASGRPVVATTAEGTGLYNEVEGCGIAVTPGSAKEFAAAIRLLVNDARLSSEMGARASERAITHWSRETVMDRLAGRISALLVPA